MTAFTLRPSSSAVFALALAVVPIRIEYYQQALAE